MDVMRFVLTIITKLAIAATGLVATLVVLLLEKLTGYVRNKAQRPVPQQVSQPIPANITHVPPPPAASTTPAVHVHVHLDQVQAQPAATPAPQPQPTAQAPNQSPPSVLNHPDHGIYVTTGSHLMVEHPASEDLLQSLDYMLYVAAHRDGDPFTVAPPLDDARHGRTIPLNLPPVAAVDEGEFFSEEGQSLPSPDGALWFRKSGEAPHRLATGTLS